LQGPEIDPRYQGSVGVLRRADKEMLRLARRSLREIPEQDIDGQGLHLVERTSGETLEVVTAFVDLIDPQASGVEAFVVRDGWFVALGRPGWPHPADKSERFGEAYGRQAEPRDPLPVPVGPVY
jgi:hypothetical protein